MKHYTMEDDQPKQHIGPPPPMSTAVGRHQVYKGIRCRSGKWVSEIREPRKTKRIWLGTYPTPEMAAAAYDAAALLLRGPDTPLNFPDHTYNPLPTTVSPTALQIREAAANAAASKAVVSESALQVSPQNTDTNTNIDIHRRREAEYIDEEELLDMPNLLMGMAEGMLLTPPTTITPSDVCVEEENLWSFTF